MANKLEVFIVGCGPSLRGFDFSRLNGLNVICANSAIFDCPQASHLITIDQTWVKYKIDQQRLAKHNCKKWFVCNLGSGVLVKREDGRVVDQRNGIIYDFELFDEVIYSDYPVGLGVQFTDFRSGNNSGYCAFQLALLLGYDRIRLLGIDLKAVDDRTHYHDYYQGFKPDYMASYFEYWKRGIGECRDKFPDVEVISHSSVSRLNDYLSYEEF